MNKLNIPLSFLLLQNITRKQEKQEIKKEEGKKLQEDYCNNEELSL